MAVVASTSVAAGAAAATSTVAVLEDEKSGAVARPRAVRSAGGEKREATRVDARGRASSPTKRVGRRIAIFVHVALDTSWYLPCRPMSIS